MTQIEFPELSDVATARLSGKVALVSGADRGVGQAQAVRLAAEGRRRRTARRRERSRRDGTASTVMFHDAETYALLAPTEADPSRDQIAGAAPDWHELAVGWVRPEGIAAATAFLVSPEARFVTGSSLRVDAGLPNEWPR